MGIGYLTAILEGRGHHVVQEYGHIKGVEYLLTAHGGDSIGHYLRAIRDPKSSVLDHYDARMEFERVSRGLSGMEDFIIERNNVRCDSNCFKGAIADLARVLRRREEHVFYPYFVAEELRRAVALAPDVIGISVADERQLVSACVLASLYPDALEQESKSWNHPRNYGRILKNLHDAGIQTHIFTIVGVPNEPINWNLRLIAFFEKFGDYILTIKSGRYRLTRRAPDEQAAHVGNLDGIAASVIDRLPLNLNRDQFSYTSSGLSRKRVEAVRDLLEEACRRHWAYQVTSTIPWWANRGRFSWRELREMAAVLANERPAEASVPDSHMKRALTKTASAIRDELGIRARFSSYEDALRTARELPGERTAVPARPGASGDAAAPAARMRTADVGDSDGHAASSARPRAVHKERPATARPPPPERVYRDAMPACTRLLAYL